MAWCRTSTTKYLLLWTNLVSAFCGLAMLIIGIGLKVEYYAFESLSSDNYYLASCSTNLIIVNAIIVLVVSFFGTFGAFKQSVCMVYMYAGIVSGILGVQVITGFFAVHYWNDLKEAVEISMTIILDMCYTQYDGNEVVARQFWDFLQSGFECCGVHGPRDWNKFVYPPPKSCLCAPEDRDECLVYPDGCYDELMSVLQELATTLGSLTIVVVVFELISVIFASILASSFHRKRMSPKSLQGKIQRTPVINLGNTPVAYQKLP